MRITPALRTRLGYGEVRGSYFGRAGGCDEKVVRARTGEEFRCYIDLFNAEKDRFPYEAERFSTVLCCELFEHLSEDPMFLMSEVNRILRSGGHLVLSTPNVAALRGVGAVLKGEHPGFYPHFIRPKDGVIEPRHAREYTPSEIGMVLESAGFSIDVIETGPYGLSATPGFEWVTELLKQHNLPHDVRGDTIHAVGRKTGSVLERYPHWLYD